MDAHKNEIARQVAWGLGWITKQELCKPKLNKRRVIELSKADYDRVVKAKFEFMTTGKRRLVRVTPLNRKNK